ncbi:MAG: cold-shock protein [Pseudomonadota bacterium]|nr:cold-shock protein [Pseudomonadota bacterium]MEC8994106.1 cold-shock protein [Pseudomonadota bacterium]MED5387158.1 cold-shock protein [Pseudomonadota bacterium]MED5530648.1 cold-shock protein [Pseudomonadota bacterium]MEE3143118.1 cold-shock protein [Pseudomonadota bacterium]|tara:strand:- start:6330 stop:6746 length:417 start_codon:yes stop_codon:yes gene_type:complete
MFNKPFSIAVILTLLAVLPLYLLSEQQFQLSTANLPFFVLSLFVLLLLSAYWSNAIKPTQKPTDYRSGELLERESGKVKWFNANKGFGFITRENGEDVFVHFRSIRGKGHRVLRDGQRVDFFVSDGEKGLQAEDVEVV